jgi:hypothetical protein
MKPLRAIKSSFDTMLGRKNWLATLKMLLAMPTRKATTIKSARVRASHQAASGIVAIAQNRNRSMVTCSGRSVNR